MARKITLPHLTIGTVQTDGLWLDDDFLWDVLPRLTPLAVYVYLAIGRHHSAKRYPTLSDLAVELGRSKMLVAQAVRKLRDEGLLNEHDIKNILNEEQA